jgi:hypothetical protein
VLGPDPGSFRDPASRVFDVDGRIVRVLGAEAADDFAALEGAGFYGDAVAAGEIVGTRRLDAVPPGIEGDWVAALEHDRIPVISYPYEWPFEMLRDAALLTLSLTERAIAAGMITKDATPYNVQFVGTRPTFIDVGSFEALRPGEVWFGHRQFCQSFLNPLLLQSRRNIPYQPWMRGSLEGITPADTSAMLHLREKLHGGAFINVLLQARLERRLAKSERDVREEGKKAGLNPKILASQVRGLHKSVSRLRWRSGESEWSSYSEREHYGDADLAAKSDMVQRVAAQRQRSQVLDLGANDGYFTELTLPHTDYAVAVDADAVVVDRLYRHLRERGERKVLPLTVDLADPPGGIGWRGRERSAFADRVRPDLVLFLAVVHHMAITRTVPLDEIVEQLAAWDAEVVAEFPLPDDPKVQRLMRSKRDRSFDRYSPDVWEAAVARRFDVVEQQTLPSGTRVLSHLRPRG